MCVTNKEMCEALEWSLDLIDMYDDRLAQIDGYDLVYSEIHLEGKDKARKILQKVKELMKCDY